MSRRPSAWRISHSTRGGCIGNASSSLAGLEAAEHDVVQARRRRRRAATSRSSSARRREDVVEVADQVDLGDEVLVDLGRDGVDADDPLVASRVPVRRRVLDEVVADGDHDVGVLEAGQRVVARLQADGAERVRVLVVERALAHERLGDADAGGAGELAQRGGGAGARDAVAGQHDRVARRRGSARPRAAARCALGSRRRGAGARGQRLGVDRRRPSRPRAARCGSARASAPGRP